MNNIRSKWSPIWKINYNKLKHSVIHSQTFSEILRTLNMSSKGGNINTLCRRLEFEKIDYSHIPRGRGASKGLKRGGVRKRELSAIMIRNSTYSRGHLKQRLIKENIIPYKCDSCQFDPNKELWQHKKLVLTLDHRNGISNDHRQKNLRFLCPNCNSQTKTFAGRRKQYSLKLNNKQR